MRTIVARRAPAGFWCLLPIEHVLVERGHCHFADDIVLAGLIAGIDDPALLLVGKHGCRRRRPVSLRNLLRLADHESVDELQRDLDITHMGSDVARLDVGGMAYEALFQAGVSLEKV
jgi:hypothetical protein